MEVARYLCMHATSSCCAVFIKEGGSPTSSSVHRDIEEDRQRRIGCQPPPVVTLSASRDSNLVVRYITSNKRIPSKTKELLSFPGRNHRIRNLHP